MAFNLFRYVQESREELGKVAWPSRTDAAKYSVIVVTACIALAVFFAALDWALTLGLQKLIGLTS